MVDDNLIINELGPGSYHEEYILRCNLILSIQVTKQQVDEFQPGTLVPSCQLELYCNDEQQKRLCHRVALIGAKEPFNFLAIQSDIMPLSQQPQRTSSVKPILDEGSN